MSAEDDEAVHGEIIKRQLSEVAKLKEELARDDEDDEDMDFIFKHPRGVEARRIVNKIGDGVLSPKVIKHIDEYLNAIGPRKALTLIYNDVFGYSPKNKTERDAFNRFIFNPGPATSPYIKMLAAFRAGNPYYTLGKRYQNSLAGFWVFIKRKMQKGKKFWDLTEDQAQPINAHIAIGSKQIGDYVNVLDNYAKKNKPFSRFWYIPPSEAFEDHPLLFRDMIRNERFPLFNDDLPLKNVILLGIETKYTTKGANNVSGPGAGYHLITLAFKRNGDKIDLYCYDPSRWVESLYDLKSAIEGSFFAAPEVSDGLEYLYEKSKFHYINLNFYNESQVLTTWTPCIAFGLWIATWFAIFPKFIGENVRPPNIPTQDVFGFRQYIRKVIETGRFIPNKYLKELDNGYNDLFVPDKDGNFVKIKTEEDDEGDQPTFLDPYLTSKVERLFQMSRTSHMRDPVSFGDDDREYDIDDDDELRRFFGNAERLKRFREEMKEWEQTPKKPRGKSYDYRDYYKKPDDDEDEDED